MPRPGGPPHRGGNFGGPSRGRGFDGHNRGPSRPMHGPGGPMRGPGGPMRGPGGPMRGPIGPPPPPNHRYYGPRNSCSGCLVWTVISVLTLVGLFGVIVFDLI